MSRSSLLLVFFCLVMTFTLTLHSKWRKNPHDSNCYTQGLSYINSTHLLETCGLYGESYFNIYFQDSNHNYKVVYKSRIFPQKYFLEGSVLFPANNMIYILTWREKVVMRYRYTKESNDFKWMTPLKWNFDGWGLTHNNTHLIASDGSDRLFICDENMTLLETLYVVDLQGNRLGNLNELEWVEEKGQQYVFANIYTSQYIVKISLKDGKVVEKIDLSGVCQEELQSGNLKYDEVLNGIAINGETMVLTGKKWKYFYWKDKSHDDL